MAAKRFRTMRVIEAFEDICKPVILAVFPEVTRIPYPDHFNPQGPVTERGYGRNDDTFGYDIPPQHRELTITVGKTLVQFRMSTTWSDLDERLVITKDTTPEDIRDFLAGWLSMLCTRGF